MLASVCYVLEGLSLTVLLQIAVAVFVVRFIYQSFQDEHRNIPNFNVEAPKVAGGVFKGSIQDALGSSCITCYNPATMEILGTAPVLSPAEVAAKVQAAKRAQKVWQQTSFAERRRVLRTLLHFIVNHQKELSDISVLETGKTAVDSAFGEVFITCEKIKYIINNGEHYLAPEYRNPGMLMLHKKAWVEYVPCGVVGLIVPWNFPVHNVLSHVVTALFSGNACVVKVSEWASWSNVYMQNMIHGLLKATGHSTDLVQFVTGYGETGSALVTAVNKVLFIGSPGVGKRVMEAGSKSLTPVTLELGGKDPFIVCDDCDLDYTASMALRGAFLNCGQNCLSAERFYVYDKVYDSFLEKILKVMPTMAQGPNKPDVGAINMPAQLEKYSELLADAVNKGAKILAGGKPHPQLNGHFFEPTLIVNVNHTMRIMREEMFGPIMCVMRVSSDEQVIELANDCDYGLGCSVFSKDYQRALRIAHSIESGMAVVNDWGLSTMVQSLPFGGVKVSGFGKFNGPEGIRDFVNQRTFVTDRFGFVLPPPKALFYPTSPRVHTLVQYFVSILYAASLLDKAKAALTLTKKILTKDF